MTKVDILSEAAKAALEDYTNPANYERVESKTAFGKRYKSLVDNLFKWVTVGWNRITVTFFEVTDFLRVIDDYSLVNFYPLDSSGTDVWENRIHVY